MTRNLITSLLYARQLRINGLKFLQNANFLEKIEYFELSQEDTDKFDELDENLRKILRSQYKLMEKYMKKAAKKVAKSKESKKPKNYDKKPAHI